MSISESWFGDNMEYMAKFPDKFFDLAFPDPPYGIGEDGLKNHSRDKLAKAKQYTPKKWDKEIPKAEYFKELFRVSKNQIIWGGNYMLENLSNTPCFLIWDKNNSGDFADAELAWTSFNTAVRIFKYTWNGMLQQDMKNKEIRIHPCQKPIGLYKMILPKYVNKGDKIIDTHSGSGSLRIAAWDLGFDFWSCEKDAEYFTDGNLRFETHKTKCEEIKKLGYAKTELSKINPVFNFS